MIGRMKPPLFVRPLTARGADRPSGPASAPPTPSPSAAARSSWPAPTACGPPQIAARLGCASQTVRNAIRAFARRGPRLPPREVRTAPASARPELDDAGCERLRALLHRSPRDFGKPTSLWTLDLAAEVAFAEGITARPVSGETIRQALKRLGVGWKRAKNWITSPDPAYLRKKRRATG